MPVDYSKWDALELSDDSDIEVHPNVDKRSFIRAKQHQIHQQRNERKQQIETLRYERTVNNGFIRRIDNLLNALQSHKDEAENRNPDELMFRSIMESSEAPEDDKPPPRPEGVHSAEKEDPTYSEMMATLADHVKTDVEKVNPSDPFVAYVAEVKKHKVKVEDLQQRLLVKLADLEKEEGRKITSESIHTGFDNSYISKSDKSAQASASPSTKGKEKATSVEVLNPQVLEPDPLPPQAEDGDEPAGKDEDEHIEPSELGKKFSLIKMSNYSALLQFVLNNPNVLAERETDGLLILAFNSQLEGKDDFARQCVHQALIIQYCRTLGHSGVSMFFNRITTKGHQAQKLFLDDVIDTYNRIRMRAKEVNTAREKGEATGGGDSEQIQLHAVDPGTSINISIPDKDSPDEAEQKSRTIFNGFSPSLQRALESGKLDEVNKVLGKMSVEDAEKIVGLLGEGGMLSVEDQIIDATTEEGQATLRELEGQERAAAAVATENDIGDPE